MRSSKYHVCTLIHSDVLTGWNISMSSISLLKFFGTASLMWTFFDIAVLSFVNCSVRSPTLTLSHPV